MKCTKKCQGLEGTGLAGTSIQKSDSERRNQAWHGVTVGTDTICILDDQPKSDTIGSSMEER